MLPHTLLYKFEMDLMTALLDWIRKWLDGQIQRVVVNSSVSQWILVATGVLPSYALLIMSFFTSKYPFSILEIISILPPNFP